MANTKDTKIDFTNCNINLSGEALAFLNRKTKGITYYDIFLTILQQMVTTTTTVKSGWREVTLHPGQSAISNEVLTKQYGFDPKTMKGIVNRMAELDILRLHRTTTTTIIDMACLSGWYREGRYYQNPLFVRAKPSATASTATNSVGSQMRT